MGRLRFLAHFALALAACGGGHPGIVGLALAPTGGAAKPGTFDTRTGAVMIATASLDDGAGSPSTDAVPVRFHGTSGVLLRDAAQLVVLDDSGLLVARRIDVGDPGDTTSSRPVAVAAVRDAEAYVARRGKNTVLAIDPRQTGALARLRTIDLSMFLDPADTDGLVDATAMLASGTRLYVALARSFVASGGDVVFPSTSLLAVIDTTTDTVLDVDSVRPGVQAIELEQLGPVALATFQGRVYVASSDAPDIADGGIEVVDPATFSTRTIVGESSLTPDMASVGDLHGLAAAGGKLVAIASDRAMIVDPDLGDVGSTLVPSGALSIVAVDASNVAVGFDRTVSVYDVATETNTTPPTTPLVFDPSLHVLGIAN